MGDRVGDAPRGGVRDGDDLVISRMLRVVDQKFARGDDGLRADGVVHVNQPCTLLRYSGERCVIRFRRRNHSSSIL